MTRAWLFVSLLALFAPPARAEEPRLLHDFARSLEATLPATEARAALTRIYPRHLLDPKECRATAKRTRVPGHMRKTVCFPGPSESRLPDCEAEIDVAQPELDRELGNLVPTVLAFARGSFTRAGADELALWVAPGYCSDTSRTIAPRIIVLGTSGVVLDLEHAPRPKTHTGFDFLGIAAKDVDDDGRHELLVEAQYYATMDITRADAYLLRLHAKRVELVAEFPNTYEHRCDQYYTDDERYKRVAILRFEKTARGPKFLEPTSHDIKCGVAR